MAVTTKTVSSGYSTGTINENFQTLEDYINNNLLNRDGTETGEANQMELSLDMNSNFVFNLPEPTLEHQAARLKDVQNAINGSDQANLITFTPYGNISSGNVQGAIQELVDGVGQSVTTDTGTQTLVDALNDRVTKQANILLASSVTGFVDSASADNTQAAIDLLDSATEGDIVDFGGKVWRVYDGVEGIASSTSTPGTDDAVALEDVPRLIGKKNITIRNGGLYAANQETAPEKRYYPSTLYLKECDGITFENAHFESRGEDFGDADAGVSLPRLDRADFIGQNGGHAVAVVRCQHVKGSIKTRFCGSTASFYCPSSHDVRLNDSFSNPASLGYSGYNIDSFCGIASETGFPRHDFYLSNCSAYSEGQLTRREDGANAGHPERCAKAGALTEDIDASLFVRGGKWGDFYGNSASGGEYLGAGFISGSSHAEISDVELFNVGLVASTTVSASDPGTIKIDNARGTVGAGVIALRDRSFGEQGATISNSKIVVTGDRLPLGSMNRSFFVWNAVIDTRANVILKDCELSGAQLGVIRTSGSVSFGGLTINGGTYSVTEKFCEISGWGGGSNDTGYEGGVRLKGRARIIDSGTETTDMIIMGNTDGTGGDNFIYFDAKDSEFISPNIRSIGTITTTGGSSLNLRKHYPELLNKIHRLSIKNHPTSSTCYITERVGLSGDFTELRIYSDSRYPLGTPAIIIGREGFVLEVVSISSGPTYNATDNVVEAVYFVKGNLTTGTEFSLDTPYVATHS